MAFKPGVSGNPAGRPKKLLKRIDEVLHEKGIEPIEEVLRILASMKGQKGAPAARLKIWMELLPYVYARPKDLPDGGGDDLGRQPTRELLKIVREKFPELKEAGK